MTHSSEISQNARISCINSLGAEYARRQGKPGAHFTKLQVTCWKVWCEGSRESHESHSKDRVLVLGCPLPISNQTQLEMTFVTHCCISQFPFRAAPFSTASADGHESQHTTKQVRLLLRRRVGTSFDFISSQKGQETKTEVSPKCVLDAQCSSWILSSEATASVISAPGRVSCFAPGQELEMQ